MTAVSRTYFGQNGTITAKVWDPSTSTYGTAENLIVGVIQNFKVTQNFETSDLYGMGSIFRKGVARYNASADVSIEYCAFQDGLQSSLAALILGPNYGKAASTAAHLGEVEDTTQLALFEFEGVFTSEDGQNQYKITVSDVYFENFPWEASTGEWIKANIEGKGKSVKIESVAVTSE